MEKDVVKTIETATATNNEIKEEVVVPVELDDTGGGGDEDKRPVIIQFWIYWYRYQQQQRSTSDHGKGCCWGNRDYHISKRWTK